MHESRMRFLRKTRGNLYSLIYRISTLMAALGRIAVLVIFLPIFMIRQGRESWKYSFRKWGAILGWSLGLDNCVSYHS
jgi:hypothetical protein